MSRARGLSEHGYANALDIRGVRLADGRFVQLTDRHVRQGFPRGLRKDACARFTTVLGPGSDGHHEEHIHVDLAERRGGYRLCQWDVLDPAPGRAAAASAAGGCAEVAGMPRHRVTRRFLRRVNVPFTVIRL